MIKRVQVLWYLNKEDLENYCIDFKEYKSHKLDGYEIVDVDEDLIYDLCDRDPDRLEPLGYFQNVKELENYLAESISNNEWELELDSPELKAKIQRAIDSVEFDGEDYYISIGDGIGEKDNRIASWFDSLRHEYNSSSNDILNINESSLDKLIPNKGRISVEEWNEILDRVYKKNKIHLGLNRVV